MNRSIEAIPTWALCYIINGDASGLTDEEIRMVDEAMRKNNIEIVSPRYNEDMCTEPYFSHYPFFRLFLLVLRCTLLGSPFVLLLLIHFVHILHFRSPDLLSLYYPDPCLVKCLTGRDEAFIIG